MIELRVVIWPNGQEVLQWRYQRIVMREELHETAGYRLVRREEWTDWRDVPKVDYRAIAANAPTKGEKP